MRWIRFGIGLLAAVLPMLASAATTPVTYSPKMRHALASSAVPVFLPTIFPGELGSVTLHPIVAIADEHGYAILWQRDPRCREPRCVYAAMTGIINDEPIKLHDYTNLHFSDGKTVSYQPLACPGMTCQPEILQWKVGTITYKFTTRENIGAAGVKTVYRSLVRLPR